MLSGLSSFHSTAARREVLVRAAPARTVGVDGGQAPRATAAATLPPACLPSQVLIWNLDIGEPVKMIDCHTDVILCMSFNTDGSLLTTTCKDKKLRVIEPRSGRVLQVEHFVDGERVLRGCRGQGVVLGPLLHSSPTPAAQPVCLGPFSACRNADLFWAGRNQRTRRLFPVIVTSPLNGVLQPPAVNLQSQSPRG